ncbi:argininosuccinate lyase [Candidatus Vidania fulgoroideorum]
MSSNNKWSKRFSCGNIYSLYKYTSSIYFDKFLSKYDIICTLVHMKMLLKLGVIKIKDFKRIFKFSKILKKRRLWKENLEDIHLNMEYFFIKNLGILGKKIRTSRSRNDLINTELKMWLFDRIKVITYKVYKFLEILIKTSKINLNSIFVGFTHFQVAQPITYSHYLMSYFEMFYRDYKKLLFVKKNNNFCPLGSCALSGSNYKIDNIYYKNKLKFNYPCLNSIDSVSDRDYIIDFLYSCLSIMIHFSRFSEDIINYCNSCINILNISDQICTGSSIMPQKKNPDIFEVVRSRVNLVIGYLFSMLSILNSQTLSYNKDNQDDKKISRNVYFITIETINIFLQIIPKINVNKNRCYSILLNNFSTATDIADYLTKNGIAFKKSHSIVSDIVNFCLKKKKNLSYIDMDLLKKNKNYIYKILKNKRISFPKISVKKSILSKTSIGGTSPIRVRKLIVNYENMLFKKGVKV